MSIQRHMAPILMPLMALSLSACSWVDSTGRTSNGEASLSDGLVFTSNDGTSQIIDDRGAASVVISQVPIVIGKAVAACTSLITFPDDLQDTLTESCVDPSDCNLGLSLTSTNLTSGVSEIVFTHSPLKAPYAAIHTVTITDSESQQSRQDIPVCINTQNEPPVPMDDTYQVCINPSDPESCGSSALVTEGVLTVAGVEWDTACQPTTDVGIFSSILIDDTDDGYVADGCLIAELVQGPSFATDGFALSPDGGFVYQPRPEIVPDATDSFTYRVSNGRQTSTEVATVTINIRGENLPPVAEDDVFNRRISVNGVAGLGNAPLDVLGNDSDPDDSTNESILISQLLNLTPEQETRISLDNNGKFINYEPVSLGEETFEYQIIDAAARTANGTVTVRTIDAPVLSAETTFVFYQNSVGNVLDFELTDRDSGDKTQLISSIESSDTAIIANPNKDNDLTFNGDAVELSIVVQPSVVTDPSAPVTITVTANDGDEPNYDEIQSYFVEIRPVPVATLSTAALSVAGGSSSVPVNVDIDYGGFSPDGYEFDVQVQNDSAGLTAANITFTESPVGSGDYDVVVTPDSSDSGSSEIVVVVSADGRELETKVIAVTVEGQVVLPNVADQSMTLADVTKNVAFAVQLNGSPASDFTLVATSSNTALLPASAISANTSSDTGAWSIAMEPVSGRVGTTTVTLSLRRAGAEVDSTSFALTVGSSAFVVNSTAPAARDSLVTVTTITAAIDVTLNGNNAGDLIFKSLTSTDQSILPNANITASAVAANGTATLSLSVLPFQVGDVTVNITMQNTATNVEVSDSFVLSLNNQLPTLALDKQATALSVATSSDVITLTAMDSEDNGNSLAVNVLAPANNCTGVTTSAVQVVSATVFTVELTYDGVSPAESCTVTLTAEDSLSESVVQRVTVSTSP